MPLPRLRPETFVSTVEGLRLSSFEDIPVSTQTMEEEIEGHFHLDPQNPFYNCQGTSCKSNFKGCGIGNLIFDYVLGNQSTLLNK